MVTVIRARNPASKRCIDDYSVLHESTACPCHVPQAVIYRLVCVFFAQQGQLILTLIECVYPRWTLIEAGLLSWC